MSNDNHETLMNAGQGERAPYAAQPEKTRGRLVPEPMSPTRSDFQRDRDRIIHSTAFRRLKDKTQVFVYDEGDHFRTRLTHTIEVSQIARALARALRLDEDLAETLALAHDLGHPPFAHGGEDAMDACMQPFGGFDHNAQSLRVVTKLERRYAAFDGLNLTWESLEGLVKHNGPLLDASGAAVARHSHGLPHAIKVYAAQHDLWLDTWPSLEAQCAAIADDIAYNAHDMDDGLRANLFCLEDVRQVPLLADILQQVDDLYPALETQRRIYECVRRVITRLIEDVIMQAQHNLACDTPADSDAVRRLGHVIVTFSPAMAEQEKLMKRFLFQHMYRAERVMDVRCRAQTILHDLFEAYLAGTAHLPENWRALPPPIDEAARARRICDFFAGMTDRYLLQDYARVFGKAPKLRDVLI